MKNIARIAVTAIKKLLTALTASSTCWKRTLYVGYPVGQRNVRKIGTPKHFEELQVGAADILDIVSVTALHIANVAWVEVHRHSGLFNAL
jgi:hypothetical protein